MKLEDRLKKEETKKDDMRKEEAPRDSKIEFQNNKKERYERNKETPF